MSCPCLCSLTQMFVKYNDLLRNFGPALAGCKGNTYVTTAHVINSCMYAHGASNPEPALPPTPLRSRSPVPSVPNVWPRLSKRTPREQCQGGQADQGGQGVPRHLGRYATRRVLDAQPARHPRRCRVGVHEHNVRPLRRDALRVAAGQALAALRDANGHGRPGMRARLDLAVSAREGGALQPPCVHVRPRTFFSQARPHLPHPHLPHTYHHIPSAPPRPPSDRPWQ